MQQLKTLKAVQDRLESTHDAAKHQRLLTEKQALDEALKNHAENQR